MALERKVLINETVLGYHEVSRIAHEVGVKTEVGVSSWKNRSEKQLGYPPSIESTLTFPYDSTLDEEACYAKIAESPTFAEYHDPIDDVLELLTDDQAVQVPNAFPVWMTHVHYHAGERLRYQTDVYRVLQDHESQASWLPPDAPSLYAKVLPGQGGGDDPQGDDGYPEWVQPDSTNPYMKGDRVSHEGANYESDIDNNVWAPTVYGWHAI